MVSSRRGPVATNAAGAPACRSRKAI
jgi:hypothetical protein